MTEPALQYRHGDEDTAAMHHPDDIDDLVFTQRHSDDSTDAVVSEHNMMSASTSKIRRKVVRLEKAVLQGSSVSVRTEQFFYFEETRAVDKKLKLNLIRNCTGDPDFPVMPLLRLEMADREYREPIRNRDKNWALDSQRHVVNLKGSEPRFDLDLGQYSRDIYHSSKLFWAAEHQSYFRETRLLRRSKVTELQQHIDRSFYLPDLV